MKASPRRFGEGHLGLEWWLNNVFNPPIWGCWQPPCSKLAKKKDKAHQTGSVESRKSSSDTILPLMSVLLLSFQLYKSVKFLVVEARLEFHFCYLNLKAF
jgi:hypothetical protein